MGKSKGGGGGGRRPTTANVAAHVSEGLTNEGREPSEVRVQRLTEGLFTVHVTVLGESEPEAYILQLNDDPTFRKHE